MNIERIRTQLIRYSWTVNLSDELIEGGWAATKRGARRAIRRAQRDYEADEAAA